MKDHAEKPVDPQSLDVFSARAASEVAKLWGWKFTVELDDYDLERLSAAIRMALNYKILFGSEAQPTTRPPRVRDTR